MRSVPLHSWMLTELHAYLGTFILNLKRQLHRCKKETHILSKMFMTEDLFTNNH